MIWICQHCLDGMHKRCLSRDSLVAKPLCECKVCEHYREQKVAAEMDSAAATNNDLH